MGTAIITGQVYQQHETGQHPENAMRAATLHKMARELLHTDSRFEELAPQPASLSQVTAVHSSDYVSALEEFCHAGGGPIDLNTTVSAASFDVALDAAGGLLAGIKGVLEGRFANAFALVRPPGHHAVSQASQGFCLFNNVAVAARYLLDEVGLERVLIVDWDVHHGNGTQDIFYDDPRVLFFSSHQFPLYPGSGRLDETGSGAGAGYNINLPLPAGSGDAVLESAFDELVIPAAERFKPQFVLVSAGYDGHWRDPLARLNLSAAGYARLTARLMKLAATFADNRLALTLEGGYDLAALSGAVQATLLTLAGTPVEMAAGLDTLGAGPGGHSPQAEPIRELLNAARRLHGLTNF